MSNIHRNEAASSALPSRHEIDPNEPIENTEQLRIAIDQGHGGDKVDAPDPAAAPLGTDDEAGGTPNSSAQVRLAAAQEIWARQNQEGQRTTGLGHAWWVIGSTVFIGASIVATAVWLRF
jgi:hypothetical protein